MLDLGRKCISSAYTFAQKFSPSVEMSNKSSDEDSTELFNAILARIQLDRLSNFAFAVREAKDESNRKSWTGPITIDSKPVFGSYHVLFPLEFSDGIKWLLKVPANGTPNHFDESAARSLTSEALTMKFLKRETTIPIPEVFAFDATLENELNCPFILMQFISGISLYDVWFDKKSSAEIVQQRRTRALEGIASSMLELDKFSFEKGGSILFDEQGNPVNVGPMRQVDEIAILERMKRDDPDETALYVDLGPFLDAKSFYISVLDRLPEPNNELGQGDLKMLRLFLEWMPQPIRNGRAFVLSHPDFNIQNMIVSEDGTLQSLIDWDGVSAVPQSMGNRSYPSWLTRDWDPSMYGYKESMDQGVEPVGVWEDSPETLAFYRSVYDEIMSSHHPQKPHEKKVQEITLTRNSLIAENLYIAAGSPLCTHAIIKKIFNEIELIIKKDQGSSAENEEEKDDEDDDNFRRYPVACALVDGTLDQRRMEYLKKGFMALLSP